MNIRLPIVAPGWISTPVADRASCDSARPRKKARRVHSRWATRYHQMAWTPGYSQNTSALLRAAGSFSRAVAMSSRIAATMGQSNARRNRSRAPERYPVPREDPRGTTTID